LLSALVAICFSVQAKPTDITVQDEKHPAECVYDSYQQGTALTPDALHPVR
ncbi:hypothetical protein L243_22070, partial [Salmonella enterica subsp. enterica serovar Worthington str. BCH-3008]